MNLEGRLVCPARVDIKEPRIARRPIGIDHQAAGLAAREANLLVENRCQRRLLALASVEAGEDEKLHRGSSDPGRTVSIYGSHRGAQGREMGLPTSARHAFVFPARQVLPSIDLFTAEPSALVS